MAFWSTQRESQRRAGFRRPPGGGQGLWYGLAQSGGVASALVGLMFCLVVMVMDCWPLEPLAYRQGQYVRQDVYSRVPFQVASPEKTEEQRRAAVGRTPAVLALDDAALQRVVGQLRNLPGRLGATSQPRTTSAPASMPAAPAAVVAAASMPAIDDAAFNKKVDQIAQLLTDEYLIVTGRDYSSAYHEKQTERIRIVQGKTASVVPKSHMVSLDSQAMEEALANIVAPLDEPLRAPALEQLRKSLSGNQAIYRLDVEATETANKAAADAVELVFKTRPAGDLLVPGQRDKGLDADQMQILAAEHDAYLHQQDAARGSSWQTLTIMTGRAGMVLAIVALVAMYILKYKPRVARDYRQLAAVAVLLGWVLLLSKMVIGVGGYNPYLAVFTLVLAGSILSISYDQRFAFALSGALALLTGLQLRLGLDELLVIWGAAAAVVFQLSEVRTRSKLLEAGGVSAVVAFVLVVLVKSAMGVPMRFMFLDGLYAAGAAIIGGFIVQGLLPLVERGFGVATSLTLLEWCDASRPLLKRLALEAPGTFNHSLLLGAMCESAAEAIGGRGLLARVGAYYHDIGKINKPDYYIENKSGPGSRHDRLSPAMSLLIIKGHVKDGLQLAREYGLPRELHEMILTHHGTTLVEYFYHAATQQNRGGRAPDESEFRYPGPKPQLKEAAILMLADAAESSVRSLSDPTPGRIEAQVHAIINKRLADGQLDDCELTLKEVHAVEVSLIKSLCGIYHGRIAYPTQNRPVSGSGSTPGPATPGTGTAGR